MSMSTSVSTCRVQSDSMQENPMLVGLDKEDGKGWGGGGGERGMTLRKGRHGGGNEGRGCWDHNVENNCDFSWCCLSLAW